MEYNILTDKNNVIIDIGTDYTIEDNGHKINNCIYAYSLEYKVTQVTNMPEEITPHKYCYTDVKGYYANINYVPMQHEEIANLKEQIELMKKALDDIIFSQGGVL